MDWAHYSLALIAGFALTRLATEQLKIRLKGGGFWVHHWILAAVAMVGIYTAGIENPAVWGGLTGVALEGLRRKNWGLTHKK